MHRFFQTKTSIKTEIIPGSKIYITGGTYVGHTAEVLGVTSKMYHIRLDNNIITKIKQSNARGIREAPPRSANCTQDDSMQHTFDTKVASNSNNPNPVPAETPPPVVRTKPCMPGNPLTHDQCESAISKALEEIHRQANIVAEFTECLRVLNLAEE
jgi:hypothetical protein